MREVIKMNKTKSPANSMDRRSFLKMSGTAALFLSSHGVGMSVLPPLQRSNPNILLIITDQQHIDTIAAGGCRYLKTPTMDQLKNRGVSFKHSFSPNPVCSPARSAIFTGRTTTETGVCVNNKSIRSDIPNIGQWFSQKTNYETVYAGKWHVPGTHTFFIPGFRVLHTGIGGQGNLGDTATSRACEAYLRNRTSSKPFLMVASFMQPHDICEWLRLNTENPDQLRYPELADDLPPLPDNFDYDKHEPEYLKKLRKGRDPVKGKWQKQQWRYYLWNYYRHIEMVDGEIGRVLQALKETGQDKNTLILLTSDHGEGLAHHQMVRKSSPYNESMKVPMVVSWPGHIREGMVDDKHMVTGLGIMPTLCEYAGIKPPENMRGKSMKPLLERKSVKWHNYIVTEVPGNRGRMVHTERYKYITYVDDSVDMLFDIKSDPGETKNLAADLNYASTVNEHRELLKAWESQLDLAPGIPNTHAWWYNE
jgi:arylsulfatase A-like enzyme